MVERTHYSAATPGSLSGKKPTNYGKGRRCVCGTRIMQYRKGDRCGLCENDDERHAKFVAQAGEADMLGRGTNKWKSADYPDGCRECPDEEKFVRRHAGNGLCSMHRQRAVKAGRDLKEEALEQAKLAAADEQRARELSRHENGIVAPLHDPRLDGRLETGAADAESTPGCCGAGEACERETCSGTPNQPFDQFSEIDGALLRPQGCPKDTDAPCCFGTEECGRGADNSGEASCDDEPMRCCGGKQSPVDNCGGPDCEHREMMAGEDWRAEATDAIHDLDPIQAQCLELFEQAFGYHVQHVKAMADAATAYHEASESAGYWANQAVELRDQLAELGLGVRVEQPLIDTGLPSDPEIRAMKLVSDALEPLDRDAKVRAMQWVLSRHGIDKPPPK